MSPCSGLMKVILSLILFTPAAVVSSVSLAAVINVYQASLEARLCCKKWTQFVKMLST